MGHLCVVRPSTYPLIDESGAIRVRASFQSTTAGSLLSSLADLIADTLVVRPGDLVFPWCVSDERGGVRGWGFRDVFRVKSGPLLLPGSEFPIAIPLELNFLTHSKPLPESEALDLWKPRMLWNAVGKKSLLRPRSITHQLPTEDEELSARLVGYSGSSQSARLGNVWTADGQPIRIQLSEESSNIEFLQGLLRHPAGERLAQLDFARLPWSNGKRFRYEKSLEGWIVQEIDGANGSSLRRALYCSEAAQFEWIANYLPFGVAGRNIDLVTLWRLDAQPRCSVVELKVGALNPQQCLDAVVQVKGYQSFVGRALAAHGDPRVVDGVVLCATGRNDKQNASVCKDLGTRFVVYEITKSLQVEFRTP